uniref:Uncharacterized protein n=1 Tax=Panagrolaimus davidi TaxID=227884 RepID=A0A914QGU0_9BILA
MALELISSVGAYHGGLSKFFRSISSNTINELCREKMKNYHGKVLADLALLRVGKNSTPKQRPQWKENDLNKRRIAQTYASQPNKIQYIKDITATII